MSPQLILYLILPLFVLAIGACIGSFLNVVIYRIPLGMSVDKPRRSFCPSCKTQIPVYLNIPLFSWLMLRGKCKWCGEKIAFRYFLVEFLTALCFLAIWKHSDVTLTTFSYQLVGEMVMLWILAALLIAATFIDIDHFIIPDSITLGGLVVGLIASFFFPVLHHQEEMWRGLVQGLIGAAIGFAMLYLVVLMGKFAFGKIRHDFDEPSDFKISQPEGEESPIVIQLGEHQYEWGDVFYRDWDRMEMEVTKLCFDGKEQEVKEQFRVVGDGFEVDGKKVGLETVKEASGLCTRAVVPREAMGFGDVKFIAMIGAFLGWEAILFTIFAASIIGAVVGVTQKLMAREDWSRPLPFGPYLAFGAFLWIFTGPFVWQCYMRLLQG